MTGTEETCDNLPQIEVVSLRSTNCRGAGPSHRNWRRYCNSMGQHNSRLVVVHSARVRYREYLLGGGPEEWYVRTKRCEMQRADLCTLHRIVLGTWDISG